ncbi:MAG: hypothetical protein AAB153_01020 [Pseudomonadota bacterium]
MSRLATTAEGACATRGGGHSETAAEAPKVTSFILVACAHYRKRFASGTGR